MDIDMELKYLKKVGAGDHDAFAILFRQYHPRIRSFLTGFIKDEELACDMAQDIFFKVWVNRATISQVTSFKGYLFRMAKNMIYDYYDHVSIKEKYDAKQREHSDSLFSDVVEEEIYAKELSLLIDILIDRMPPQRREIFIMSRKEGLSNDEIALQLNINKRTVENHITQALSDLRRMLFLYILFFLPVF